MKGGVCHCMPPDLAPHRRLIYRSRSSPPSHQDLDLLGRRLDARLDAALLLRRLLLRLLAAVGRRRRRRRRLEHREAAAAVGVGAAVDRVERLLLGAGRSWREWIVERCFGIIRDCCQDRSCAARLFARGAGACWARSPPQRHVAKLLGARQRRDERAHRRLRARQRRDRRHRRQPDKVARHEAAALCWFGRCVGAWVQRV